MSDCRCFNPPFHYADYVKEPVGTDTTNRRYGEVSLETCRHCGTRWLHYLVEYEAFTGSSRWFRGLITEQDLARITPEGAVPFLESLPWYFEGGSYFDSRGRRGSGPVPADNA